MTDFTTETISNFLYSKVDSIIIVDIQNSDYQAIKCTGVFEKIIAPNGNYHELIKKLWFHFNKSSNKISEDYQIFLPMLGKFSGKYSNKINFVLDDVIHIVQLSIYPLNEQNTKYMFLLDELDNSKYIRDFMAHKKVDTIHNTFLFSMHCRKVRTPKTQPSLHAVAVYKDSLFYICTGFIFACFLHRLLTTINQFIFLRFCINHQYISVGIHATFYQP